ncbi:MAG: type II toxin-antitoxin system HicA family toxin [Oscillospiraceae bacterium]|jgi:predicted RNA binding protein YcfA (HicA-like mRNA interferase family)|nr:type II toxin-antitoxin system HicA family toxin [Oscillospiraceae bacterium]
MPPVIRPDQVIKVLECKEFQFVSQKGSHRKYKRGGRTVVIPMHYELAKGTLMRILRQAGLSLEDIFGG